MCDMNVFISSLIGGFGQYRDAAKRAIAALRHSPVMAEDFGAKTSSPQIACLQGVRQSDLVVLILGEGYGPVQTESGLSATHEEYREARDSKKVLAFIQQGVTPEPHQAEFIAEVEGWESGLYRAGFTDADDLNTAVVRALHDVAMSDAVGAADTEEMSRRAFALIPPENRNVVTGASVDIAIACGPRQQVLRPVEIEDSALAETLLQAGLFGTDRLFVPSLGNDVRFDSGALVIRQEGGASFRLNEDGSILIRQPLDEPAGRRGWDMGGHMVIVQEVVQARLGTALSFCSMVLDRIDRTERVTDLAVAASIAGAEYRAWRTRAQNEANPGSVTVGMGGRERGPVVKTVRRPALRVDRMRLIEDMLVPLRRQFPAG